MIKDYYKMLEITPDASAKDIKRAYRKLALQHHPDVNRESVGAEAFLLINEAYRVLGDLDARRRYDINRKYGLETREIFVEEDKFRQGDGRKYGTAYKYPPRPKRPVEKDDFQQTNTVMNHMGFYVLLVIGLVAIYASIRDLMSNHVDDKTTVPGLAFGLTFTFLLIYGFWYYYYKKE